MICPSNFLRSESIDIAYLHNNLYKILHMIEGTK